MYTVIFMKTKQAIALILLCKYVIYRRIFQQSMDDFYFLRRNPKAIYMYMYILSVPSQSLFYYVLIVISIRHWEDNNTDEAS